jgi:hypothetical protein
VTLIRAAKVAGMDRRFNADARPLDLGGLC